METGIIKQWNNTWGIIYAPGGLRFFLHSKYIVSGRPELFRRVTFDVGTARSATEIPPAINVHVGDLVSQPTHSAPGTPEVRR